MITCGTLTFPTWQPLVGFLIGVILAVLLAVMVKRGLLSIWWLIALLLVFAVAGLVIIAILKSRYGC